MGSGGVILGRNATVILAQHPGALHVRLNAPAHIRVGRAVELDGITAEVAEERREQEDLIRAELSQRIEEVRDSYLDLLADWPEDDDDPLEPFLVGCDTGDSDSLMGDNNDDCGFYVSNGWEPPSSV